MIRVDLISSGSGGNRQATVSERRAAAGGMPNIVATSPKIGQTGVDPSIG